MYELEDATHHRVALEKPSPALEAGRVRVCEDSSVGERDLEQTLDRSGSPVQTESACDQASFSASHPRPLVAPFATLGPSPGVTSLCVPVCSGRAVGLLGPAPVPFLCLFRMQ